jgi:hypothetical protein
MAVASAFLPFSSITGSGSINPLAMPRVTSFPSPVVAGDTVVVINDSAVGDCNPGGGSFETLCEYNGSAWVKLGDGGAAGATSVTAASTFGTDNQLLRSDGTGRGAQASGVTLDDSNNMTVPGNLTVNGSISTAGAGPTVIEMNEGTAPGAPATAGHHNLYIDSADSRLKSHENGGSVVAYATPASTDTLTNKSYDAEGSGNVFTYKKYKYIPMAGCNNATPGSVWDLPQKLPGISRQRFHIPPLAFSKDSVKSERRFTRTREARKHNQFITRHFHTHILQVVSPRAFNNDFVLFGHNSATNYSTIFAKRKARARIDVFGRLR